MKGEKELAAIVNLEFVIREHIAHLLHNEHPQANLQDIQRENQDKDIKALLKQLHASLKVPFSPSSRSARGEPRWADCSLRHGVTCRSTLPSCLPFCGWKRDWSKSRWVKTANETRLLCSSS
jgi:hypothetical protein